MTTHTNSILRSDNLSNLSYDQLGVALDIYSRREAAAIAGSVAHTRACAGLDRVKAEIVRRGATHQKAWDGRHMVGPASHFAPLS